MSEQMIAACGHPYMIGQLGQICPRCYADTHEELAKLKAELKALRSGSEDEKVKEALKWARHPAHECRDAKVLAAAVVSLSARLAEAEQELTEAIVTSRKIASEQFLEGWKIAREQFLEGWKKRAEAAEAKLKGMAEALKKLRDAVKASGKMNGREYDALGIEVNKALAGLGGKE